MPYLSEIQHRRVLGPGGDEIGRLVDVAVLPREQFPVVHWGILGTGGGERVVSWSEVAIEPAHIRLRHRLDRLAPEALPPESLRLGRDLLDKQIVDTHGAKVVRVNDVKLSEENGSACVTDVDEIGRAHV